MLLPSLGRARAENVIMDLCYMLASRTKPSVEDAPGFLGRCIYIFNLFMHQICILGRKAMYGFLARTLFNLCMYAIPFGQIRRLTNFIEGSS